METFLGKAGCWVDIFFNKLWNVKGYVFNIKKKDPPKDINLSNWLAKCMLHHSCFNTGYVFSGTNSSTKRKCSVIFIQSTIPPCVWKCPHLIFALSFHKLYFWKQYDFSELFVYLYLILKNINIWIFSYKDPRSTWKCQTCSFGRVWRRLSKLKFNQ